jgi:hypothetical protein
VAPDPRLASVELLALAALRLRQRQQSESDPHAVRWLNQYYDDPTEAGYSPSGIFLPKKYATAEEWLQSPLVAFFRDNPGQPWGGNHGKSVGH